MLSRIKLQIIIIVRHAGTLFHDHISIILCQLWNFSLSKHSRQALVLTPHDYLVHNQPLIEHTSIIGVTADFQMMWTPPFHTFRVHRFTPTFLYYTRNHRERPKASTHSTDQSETLDENSWERCQLLHQQPKRDRKLPFQAFPGSLEYRRVGSLCSQLIRYERFWQI